MSKKISLDRDALQKLLAGANILADTVGLTLGPRGRNVLLSRKDEQSGAALPPLITSDGDTIAKAISLSDPMENMGVQLLHEAAAKTNDAAGDGTTTATVLAQAILCGGYQNIAAGADPLQLRSGMAAAVQAAQAALEREAIPAKTRRISAVWPPFPPGRKNLAVSLRMRWNRWGYTALSPWKRERAFIQS